MVWLRIWLVSLPANVVFVWGSATTLRCLFLLIEVQWTKRFMFYLVPWLVAPVLIALSWFASWQVLAVSSNAGVLLDDRAFLNASWLVTFVTSLPMDPDGETRCFGDVVVAQPSFRHRRGRDDGLCCGRKPSEGAGFEHALTAHVGLQHIGHPHAPVLELVLLHDGDQRAAGGHGRRIQV